MRKPISESLPEQIDALTKRIEALEKRVETLEKARGVPAGAQAAAPRSAVPAGTYAGTPGNEEMTLVILAAGRAWRSGTGHFYFCKKDGTEEVGSVGISLNRLGGNPLEKGDRIHITTSRVEADNYRGEERFQCFADTVELLADNAPTAEYAPGDGGGNGYDSAPPAGYVPEEPPPAANSDVDPDDDIPF